jgi:GT2 family glycosyltransferase
MFKLSIVIPTYHRKESIIHVLELLEKQVLDGIEATIIVVVDGSGDGTREAIRRHYPGVTIIDGDGNWWWTRSVNEGCKLAMKNHAAAVLLLNDDIEFGRDYLQNLLTAAAKEPAAVIGSLNLTWEKENRIFFSGAKRLRWWDGKLQKYHPFLAPCRETLSGMQQSIVLPGRGLFIPAAAFDAIGYFNERALPQYKADYEFVLRAHKHHLPTLISWDSVIYVQMQRTGAGATFSKQGFFTFFRSLFQEHSRTNLIRNFFYYKAFYPVWALPLFPFTALMIAARQFFLFFKTKK